MTKRKLVLENGSVFIGDGFGSDRSISGEVVFYTGMTGYQEVISDPTNAGHIVIMTYPLVGNYGINRDDFETVAPFINGLIVKEVCDMPSNFRADENLASYLEAHHIPGISGIDTRKLTKIIRQNGIMKGYITGVEESTEHILELLRSLPEEKEQVKLTSNIRPYVVPGRGKRIVLVDFGMKHGILRELTKRNCHITVVPYNYDLAKILRLKPDGIVLSNGPGNPEHVPEAVEMIKHLIPTIPLFGIGLGHQLLALACGAKTDKMKFGHHGGNYPVKDLEKERTFLTSQNHSFHVAKSSLENTELFVTQISLNDDTVEGLKHKKYPAFSVQYNPESSPGPEDTNFLFDDFLHVIKTYHNPNEVELHA